MITLDLLGMIASLLATYYFMIMSQKAWIITLVAALLNGYLYWHQGIYADSMLELFYFGNACYGWYLWSATPQEDNPVIIHTLKTQYWILLVTGTTLLFGILCFLLRALTSSDVVLLDATTTTLSLLAQLLMAYKVIYTWLLWFVIDAIYCYLYLHKHIPFHAVLMLFYLALAISGYYRWQQESKKGQMISTQVQQNPVQ
ncbi:MAG: nicotinamide mononucleotide transporter [Legionella sp.]|nr:nicotinamide mononucleotide transporter [Legionella sp.]